MDKKASEALRRILRETLIFRAAAQSIKEEIIVDQIDPKASRHWSYSVSKDDKELGQVHWLSTWDENYKSTRDVCFSISWKDILFRHNGKKFPLPLEREFLLKDYFVSSGEQGDSPYWNFGGALDQSFLRVFGYKLEHKDAKLQPLSDADLILLDRDSPFLFRSQTGKDSSSSWGGVPTVSFSNDGQDKEFRLDTTLRIVACVSLVCMKKSNDFDPLRKMQVARFVPHVMIAANWGVDQFEAAIEIMRYSSDSESPIKAALFTESNSVSKEMEDGLFHPHHLYDFRWDKVYDYYLIDPPATESRKGSLKVVRTDKRGRRISKLKDEENQTASPAYSVVFEGKRGILEPIPIQDKKTKKDVLPEKDEKETRVAPGSKLLREVVVRALPLEAKQVIKLDRQGEFDNIVLGPRPPLSTAQIKDMPEEWPDEVRARNVVAAPFGDYDCLAIHWRWGARLASLIGGNSRCFGWGNGEIPFSEIGAPMVPQNQDVELEILNEGCRYIAIAHTPTAGNWQVFMHHGAAYVLHSNLSWPAFLKPYDPGHQGPSSLYWWLRYGVEDEFGFMDLIPGWVTNRNNNKELLKDFLGQKIERFLEKKLKKWWEYFQLIERNARPSSPLAAERVHIERLQELRDL